MASYLFVSALQPHWVFTVDEPLLAARERHESRADGMARHAQALREQALPRP